MGKQAMGNIAYNQASGSLPCYPLFFKALLERALSVPMVVLLYVCSRLIH